MSDEAEETGPPAEPEQGENGGLLVLPPRRQRYDGITHGTIRDLIVRYQDDTADPYDLLDEVGLLRSLVTHYVNEYNEVTQALLAWHASFLVGEAALNPKPRKVMDITEASKLIDSVGAMVERVHKMRTKNAVSEKDLNRLINAMSRVVDVVIPNGEIPMELTGEMLKAKIRDGWLVLVTKGIAA